jgi:hypothetical protein
MQHVLQHAHHGIDEEDADMQRPRAGTPKLAADERTTATCKALAKGLELHQRTGLGKRVHSSFFESLLVKNELTREGRVMLLATLKSTYALENADETASLRRRLAPKEAEMEALNHEYAKLQGTVAALQAEIGALAPLPAQIAAHKEKIRIL